MINKFLRKIAQDQCKKKIEVFRIQRRQGPTAQSLLSCVQPYVEVPSSTVARWIKKALKLAGIDVPNFKGHSTGAVSFSKANNAGLFLADILAKGSWSSRSTRAEIIQWENYEWGWRISESSSWLTWICALKREWKTRIHSDKSRLGEINTRSR